MANVGTVNGGGGGGRSPGSNVGNTGAAGTQPGANFTGVRGMVTGQPNRGITAGGYGGIGGGVAGNPGLIFVVENTGT
jgi:hypothetical protein